MVERLYLVVHYEDFDGSRRTTGVRVTAPHIPQVLDEELVALAKSSTYQGWSAEQITKYFRDIANERLGEIYGAQMEEMEAQLRQLLVEDPTAKLSTVQHAVVGIAYDIAEGVRMNVQNHGQEYVRQHGERIRAESKKETT